MKLADFKTVWVVDFEFGESPDRTPEPRCVVAWEYFSRRRVKVWEDSLLTLTEPPYDIDATSILVAYSATAELGCHLALGWPLPEYVLDLYTEFKVRTNGLYLPLGRSLPAASGYFGLAGTNAVHKETMRELALRGGPWTDQEKANLLRYCESDVRALDKLLRRMFEND